MWDVIFGPDLWSPVPLGAGFAAPQQSATALPQRMFLRGFCEAVDCVVSVLLSKLGCMDMQPSMLQDVTQAPLPQLPQRRLESHKGDYGRVLVVGGSRGMAGAPALAGRAALRGGAGLVTIVVPESIQATVASFEPSYMTVGLGGPAVDCLTAAVAAEIAALTARTSSVVLGPGLGTSPTTQQLVTHLYAGVSSPMVVDADALQALAQDTWPPASGPRVLTPHGGEFQRLTGQSCAPQPAERAQQAAALCQRDGSHQTIVVLKGHQTIVTDGRQYAVNGTGNPGLATGGTGDCLTGVIAALVGQGLTCWEAARLGVHLHGLAGDLAAAELGQVALIASDLIDYLPGALLRSMEE